MTTEVLYHENCTDGFGAAYSAWKKLGNSASYVPVNYGNPVPPLAEGCDVFIVDFSYPAEALRLICQGRRVTVLDHHATAEKDLSGLEIANCKVVFDMKKSGAVLAWEHFNPATPIPQMILYLQDRDLWSFRLPNSRAVSAYMQTLPMDFSVWQRTSEELESETGRKEIVSAGAACLRLKERMVLTMAQNNRWVCFDLPKKCVGLWQDAPGVSRPEEGWFWVPCSNATVFFSEVGEKLLEMFPSVAFTAYYLDRRDGKRQWGLRSGPDFDCSVIAKTMGGGGHKQASGFTQDI